MNKAGERPDDEASGGVRAACGLRERDIDLLLLEELHCSPKFRAWFLRHITGDSLSVDFNAQHSVAHTLGESDLEIRFLNAKHSSVVVLVENKLSADFQHKQPERYQQRATRYKEAGTDLAITVLLSPATYNRRGCNRFDKRLSYEEIRDWLANSDSGMRAKYKADLITSALERASGGYTVVPDKEVSAFWHQYWNLAEREAPQLQMPEPGPKPAGAGFIRFFPLELPRGACLIHKIRLGHLDLEFPRLGERLEELWSRYGSYLDSNMGIEKATGSQPSAWLLMLWTQNIPSRHKPVMWLLRSMQLYKCWLGCNVKM